MSELTHPFPPSLSRIYISASEACDIHGFVEQYLETRGLRGNCPVREEVVGALKGYPGEAPVRLYELNAWIDRSLRQQSGHRPTIRLLKVIISNGQILRWG